MSGKRLLSVLMAVVLAVGLMPMPAFAEGGLTGAHALLGLAASNIASGTSGTCTWTIDSSGKLTVKPTSGSSGTLGLWVGLDEDVAPWIQYAGEITSAEFVGNVKAQTCAGMFAHCSSLTSLDLSHLDTSEVENMGWMFYDCSSLKVLDLTGIDTSKVSNMFQLFVGCSSLASLDLSGFDTSKVESMHEMFDDCSSLTSLDLLGFDTSKVTDTARMFEDCSSLTSLDLSRFDTSEVVDMWGMFAYCSSLTSLDLSGFDTSKVRNMEGAFIGCSSLTSLDLSRLNTSRAKNIRYMFYGCSSLASLDLSSFDTSNVQDMDNMFDGCSSLTSLGLSGFNTSKVKSMEYMFCDCSNLRTITVGSKWRAANNGEGMFAGCESLVGGSGTKYDSDYVGPARAVVDKPGQKGYLTGSGSIADSGKETDLVVATYGPLQAKASKVTKSSITLTWRKVKGAKRYVVYGSQCNLGNVTRKVVKQATKKANATRATFKKLKDGEGEAFSLKKGTYYKFVVAALDAGGNVISTSRTIHVATAGGKVGNAKRVTTAAKKGKVSLKEGKKFKLRAKTVPANEKLIVKRHRAIAYESSNPEVASVSRKGVVKAQKRGTCTVYAFAQNGVCAKVRVTVR